MTLSTVDFVYAYRAAQYDGTNGEEICSSFTCDFKFDNGTTLRFEDVDTVEHNVSVGQWVAWIPGAPSSYYNVLDSMPTPPYLVVPS